MSNSLPKLQALLRTAKKVTAEYSVREKSECFSAYDAQKVLNYVVQGLLACLRPDGNCTTDDFQNGQSVETFMSIQ